MNLPTLKSISRLTRLDFLDGVGVAISESEVTFVHLRKRLMYIRLMAHRSYPLAGDAQARRSALSQAAAKFLDESQAPSDHVFVSLPRKDAIVGHLAVPAAARADLDQVVEFEVERILPLGREQIFFDYLVRSRADKLDIQVVALPREAVSEVLLALESAAIYPRSLVVHPVALANLVGFSEVSEEKPVAFVHQTASGGGVDVIAQGKLLSSHRFLATEVAGADQRAALAAAEAGAAGVSREEVRVVELTPLSAEGSEGPAAETCAGDAEILGELLAGLQVADEANSGLEFRILPALGAGLAAVREASEPLNLLPPEKRQSGAEGAPVLTFFLATSLALVTMMWIFGSMAQDYRIRAQLDAELAALAPQLREVRDQEREAQLLTENLQILRGSDRAAATVYLRELTGLIPTNAYLTSFRMRKGKVEIEGFAKGASELIPAIEKSRYFSAAQFTSPVTQAQNNEERFSLSTRIAE